MAKRKRSTNDSSGPTRGKKAKAQLPSLPSAPEEPPEPIYPYSSDTGIPLTDVKPNYGLLQNPLPFRENFSLSHSLAQSRNKWLSGAMFTKYWTRPPRGRKLQEGEVNAREKMSKLCECVMVIGPHIFETKLFLVKDDIKDEDPAFPANDPNALTNNTIKQNLPHDNVSVDSTLKPANTQNDQFSHNPVASAAKPHVPASQSSQPVATPATSSSQQQKNHGLIPAPADHFNPNSSEKPIAPKPTTSLRTPSAQPQPSISTPSSSSAPQQTNGSGSSSNVDSLQSTTQRPFPNNTQPKSFSNVDSSSSAVHPVQQTTTQRSTSQQPAAQQPQPQPSTQQSANKIAPSNTNSITSNPENVQTIYKLQAIARIDRSLSSLMKIVASGSASHEQITEFQGYINRVRTIDLKDIPKYFTPDGPVFPDEKKSSLPLPQKPGPSLAPGPFNRSLQTSVPSVQNPLAGPSNISPQIIKRGPKPPKPPKTLKPPKEKKFKDVKKKEGEEKLKSTVGRKKKDPSKPKSPYISKKQQKRVTIVFEFKDNPADRYIIPKNSMIEILPTNEVLVSFFLSFPEGGRSATTKELPPGNVKPEPNDKPNPGRSKSPGEPVPDVDSKDTDSKDEVSDSNANKTNTKKGHETAVAKPSAGDEKSELYYPLTVTIRDIPVKSLPILERSVHRPQEVYLHMQNVIDTRKRAKDWWVWFEVDRSDEALIEKLMQPAKPPENMFVPARVRVYKSKKKAKAQSTDASAADLEKKEDGEHGPNGSMITGPSSLQIKHDDSLDDEDRSGSIGMVDNEDDHNPNGNISSNIGVSGSISDPKHNELIDPLLFEETGKPTIENIDPSITNEVMSSHQPQLASLIQNGDHRSAAIESGNDMVSRPAIKVEEGNSLQPVDAGESLGIDAIKKHEDAYLDISEGHDGSFDKTKPAL